MLVLIVLTIFTSFKAGAFGASMAPDALLHLTGGQNVAHVIELGFALFFQVTLIMLATPGLIYFKLLDEAPVIVSLKSKTQAYPISRRLSWAYLSPRVPSVFVYAIVVWLIVVSSHGRPMEGTWMEIIAIAGARYIPVIAEVGLAYLVGTVLTKQRNFNAEALALWREQVGPWDKAHKNAETQPEYLRILFLTIREQLVGLRKNKRNPNEWMMDGNQQVVSEIVAEEYRRFQHAGMEFARMVQGAQVEKAAVVKAMKTEKKPSAPMKGKRTPPKGHKGWTVATLTEDFAQRKLDRLWDYNEAGLQEDYAPDYGARAAWRKGAKQYFQKYRE